MPGDTFMVRRNRHSASHASAPVSSMKERARNAAPSCVSMRDSVTMPSFGSVADLTPLLADVPGLRCP